MALFVPWLQILCSTLCPCNCAAIACWARNESNSPWQLWYGDRLKGLPMIAKDFVGILPCTGFGEVSGRGLAAALQRRQGVEGFLDVHTSTGLKACPCAAHAVLCWAVLCHAVLCCAVLCFTALHHTMLCPALLCCGTLCCTMLHHLCTVQQCRRPALCCSDALHCAAVLSCTVLQ